MAWLWQPVRRRLASIRKASTSALSPSAPTRRFTLTNSGSAALTLSGATFSGPFAQVTDSTGCAAFPLTLNPGATCDLVVRYTPVNPGSNSGSIVLNANVAGGSSTIALTGQATAAPAANATPQNTGGGGCSASQDVNDPMLAFLVLLAGGVIFWRRKRST